MPALHHGVPVVSRRFAKFSGEAAFELMATHRVRNAFLPPTALKIMRAVPDAATRWKLQLRTVASGGETLGARRPLRVPVTLEDARAEGDVLHLRFTLPAGSYATVLLRELIKE